MIALDFFLSNFFELLFAAGAIVLVVALPFVFEALTRERRA